jgi:hypothetical protein
MTSSSKKTNSVGRRGFLKGAAAGAAALVANPPEAANAQPPQQSAIANATAPTPTQAALNVDVGN